MLGRKGAKKEGRDGGREEGREEEEEKKSTYICNSRFIHIAA
jgi:hypothetical protein